MFFAEVLGFWLVVGVGFFGWRRLANGKEYQPLGGYSHPTADARHGLLRSELYQGDRNE